MKDKSRKIRIKIKKRIRERARIESELLENTRMAAASFCIRPDGMYYLSASINGESRHRYVRQEEKEHWEKLCIKWRHFSEAIARWVKVSIEIEGLLRKLGRSRLEPLPKRKAKPGEEI